MATRTTRGQTHAVTLGPSGSLVAGLLSLLSLPPADRLDGIPDLEQPTTIELRQSGALVATLALSYGPNGDLIRLELLTP